MENSVEKSNPGEELANFPGNHEARRPDLGMES
jgi:hypothetical protein